MCDSILKLDASIWGDKTLNVVKPSEKFQLFLKFLVGLYAKLLMVTKVY